mmetsp:Transcript_27450/g.88132  ORF Transcript_27450/g.88132 Transcript_27450/m.88132 type:complete len:383 (+) Transcript_27450:538-1686(+)
MVARHIDLERGRAEQRRAVAPHLADLVELRLRLRSHGGGGGPLDRVPRAQCRGDRRRRGVGLARRRRGAASLVVGAASPLAGGGRLDRVEKIAAHTAKQLLQPLLAACRLDDKYGSRAVRAGEAGQRVLALHPLVEDEGLHVAHHVQRAARRPDRLLLAPPHRRERLCDEIAEGGVGQVAQLRQELLGRLVGGGGLVRLRVGASLRPLRRRLGGGADEEARLRRVVQGHLAALAQVAHPSREGAWRRRLDQHQPAGIATKALRGEADLVRERGAKGGADQVERRPLAVRDQLRGVHGGELGDRALHALLLHLCARRHSRVPHGEHLAVCESHRVQPLEAELVAEDGVDQHEARAVLAPLGRRADEHDPRREVVRLLVQVDGV